MSQTLDLDAEAYARFATDQLARGKEMLNEISLKGDETILDIGCGPGTLTKNIAERVPNGKVIRIDASPSMIVYAKALGIKNAEFFVIDATKIPYENTFDLVFSNSVFTQLAKELCQKESYKTYLKDLTWPKARFTKEKYQALLEHPGGFADIEVLEKESERILENEEHLKGWLSSMHRKIYTESLPEPLREPFFKAFVEGAVCSVSKTYDGKLSLGKSFRLHVKAR